MFKKGQQAFKYQEIIKRREEMEELKRKKEEIKLKIKKEEEFLETQRILEQQKKEKDDKKKKRWMQFCNSKVSNLSQKTFSWSLILISKIIIFSAK